MAAEYEYYLYKGKELFNAGEPENAIDIYSKAILIAPNEDKAYYNRGCCRLKLKQYEEAIEDFTKAIKLNTHSDNSYAHRGLCYQNLKQYEKAIDDYTEAIELNPLSCNSLLYRNRGDCYKLNGEYYYAKKDYSKAFELDYGPNKEEIKNLILEVESKNDLLSELQTQYKEENTKINELLKELGQNKEASNSIKKLKFHIKEQYFLKKDIEKEQRRIDAKQKAEQESEKLYEEAQILYNANNKDFDKILNSLNKAIELSPKKEYEDMIAKVKNENNFIIAEKSYEEAKEYCNNKEFDKGLTLITKAIKLSPSNRIYIDLKQKIDWERKKFEKNEQSKIYFEDGVHALQDGDFAEAIKYFKEVLNIQPNNSDCKTLLNKAQIGKIDILNCSKKALLTLDFINEKQAENIIQARNNGMMWYDYKLFAQQFGIMPHQWTDVEENIIFPLKQANKYGRRLDI